MAKVVIAELDIDIAALLKSTSDLKKEIDALKNTQKDLAASGQSTSEAFIQNEAVLKTLNSAYASNVKAVAESGKATQTQADQTEMLNLALNTEVSSIAEARQQNQLLNKLRNETNVTTKEGQAQLTALNAKLNSNNDFIKENADQYLKQKINIGNYSESIKEAAQSMNPLNGGLAGFAQRAQDAGGVLPLVKTGLTGVISGIGGMISASLAFIATPIGAIIAAIALTLGILVSVFKTFQPVVDKAEQAVAAIGSALNVVKNTILAVVTGTKSLSEAFSGLGGSMSNAAKEAANLTKAQQDLDDVMQAQEITTAKNRAEINKLNVQLKDRTKTEKERLAISDQIIKKEQADFEQRKKIVDEEVRIARGVIANKAQFTAAERKLLKEQGIGAKELAESKGGNYDAEFEALNKARLKAIALENEVSVNIEKQYTRRNKIEDEAAAKAEKAAAESEKNRQKQIEKANKAIDNEIAKSKQEIDLFIAQQGFRKKSTEDEYEFNKKIYDKELADLNIRYKNGKVSKLEYETAKLNLSNDYAQKNADLLIQEGQREVDRIKANSKLSIDEKLKAEMDFAALRLQQGLINEQQYQDEITKLQNDAELQRQNKKLADEKLEKERKVIDLENERATGQLNFEQDVEIQKQQNAIKLQEELAAAEKSGADQNLIKAKYAKINKDLDQSVETAKIQGAINTFGQIAQLLGEQSAIGKAFALSQTILSGIQGVQNAYTTAQKSPITTLFPAYPIVQAGLAGAFSAIQVAKISGVKFEKGGIQEIGGKRHSAGGTKFWGEDGTMFEAEAGEGIGILNRNAFASFMDFNNAHLGGRSTGGFFQGGGIITQGVRPETLNIESVVDAIASMPAPVVAVEEIQTVGNRYTNVVSGANL
jgi:hypothetical protein